MFKTLDYQQAEQFLFEQLPFFSREGASAYKPGLSTSIALDNYFSNPHKAYKTIHIAGTNGKGSVSNLIASVLTQAGYKTGLYTSPHIVDFKERIRVNGVKIPEKTVTDFVNNNADFFLPLKPSFFELTSTLCFEYFKQQHVDVAVIETGLGGRLDSTNIINPELSIITNISFDHMMFLGNTLPQIASEKAGIIKRGVPVVVGESDSRTNNVFLNKAAETESPIILASNKMSCAQGVISDGFQVFNVFKNGEIVYPRLRCALLGNYQQKNVITALASIEQLIKQGFEISRQDIYDGFENVVKNTGFFGRWQIINTSPLIVCDTGHNEGGFEYTSKQIVAQKCKTLRIVIGFVKDKDINKILRYLPQNAIYYFCNADNKRALKAEELKNTAAGFGLEGLTYPSAKEAFEAAKNDADPDDFIFVGGSNFIVAEIF